MGSQSFTYGVPLFNLPGRHGLNLNLSLIYNSLVWQNAGTAAVVYNPDTAYQFYTPSPGFRLDFGNLIWSSSNGVTTGAVLIDPSGAKHPLVSSGNNMFTSADSTYITVQHNVTSSSSTGFDVATYKNGTQVFYQFAIENSLGNIIVTQPVKIEDSTGNFIAINHSAAPNQFFIPAISSVVDTAGRQINFFYTTVSGNTVVNCVTDGASCTSSGAHTFTFNWNPSYVLNYNFSNVVGYNGWSSTPPPQGSQFPFPVLTGVTRPDGTSVRFNYGDWLMVNDIQELSSSGNLRYETSYNFPAASAGVLSSPPTYTQQTATTIDKDGNNQQLTWNYQAVIGGSISGIPAVSCFAVTDPAGTSSINNFSTKSDFTAGLPVQQIAGTGSSSPCTSAPTTTWQTASFAWTSDSNGANPRPASQTSILSDGQTQSQVQYATYDTHGDPTDVKEFDYGPGGPGPLLRETVTGYATNLGSIFGLPNDIQIKDGSGTLLSHETFTYDNYSGTPLQPESPLPTGFDSNNPNFAASSTTPRGNLTASTIYANAAAGTDAITSTSAYDMFGNPVGTKSGTSTGAQTSTAYSISTEYAYPDSVSVGPAGNQLTTSFTYNMAIGAVASVTDPNSQKDQFTQDIDGRPANSTTPDNITTSYSYDDAASNLGVSVATTALPNAATKSVSDFLGRPLIGEVLDNSSPVSTTYHVYDLPDRLNYVSNPSGPNDSIQYTSSNYDPLGRTTAVTPPGINAYQTQYTPTTFTDSSGATHSGLSITSTDPSNKQRRQYFDGLGRLVRVDEPGGGTAAAASGSLAINGTLQSWSATQTATSGHVELTFSGALLSKSTCSSGQPCSDSGTITVTVNWPKAFNVQVPYSSSTGTDSEQPVQAIVNAFNTTNGSPVTAKYFGVDESGNVVMDLYAKATGSASNYGLATSIVSNDPTDFPNPSFTVSAGPSLIGGTDPSTASTSGIAYLTFSCTVNGAPCSASNPNQPTETGSITINVTNSNGQTLSQSASFTTAPGTDPSQVVQTLTNGISSNNSFPTSANWTTDESGDYVLELLAKTTGSGTNYPLSVSITSSPNSSYAVSAPSALSGGQTGTSNSTVFDSGVVYLSIGPFIASAPYSQNGNNTAALVAGALVNGPNGLNQSSFPVKATVSGSTISLTYKVPGSAGNLPVNVYSSTENPDNPSFTSPGTTLSGGADAQPSLSTPNSTFYSYDALGNLLKVIEGQQTRSYGYDSLGRLTSSCIPETANKCTTLAYTDFGAVKTSTDPRSIVTTYGFDTWNHVNDITYGDGKTPEVKFTFGGPSASNNLSAGLLVSSSVVNGTTKSYQYDVMGHVTQVAQTIGANTYTTKYSYTNGHLSTMAYPSASAGSSGTTASYAPDDIGRLKTVTANGATVYSVNSYNAANAPLSTSYGNNVMNGGYGYNNLLQLSSIQYGTSTTPLISLSYGYAQPGDNGAALNNGQIQGITDNLNEAHSTVYSYDALGRLLNAGTFDEISPVSWGMQFGYDRYGNRASQNPVSGKNSMPSVQLTIDPTTNRITGSGIAYDNAGNMTSDSLLAYRFDAANRITSVSQIGSSTPLAQYTYDDNGLRTNKNGNAYIYSGGDAIAEYANGSAAGSPSAEYIYAGSRRVATLINGAFTYHYPDHLSNRVSTDANGNVVRTYGSFPFGETWYESGTANKWKFTTYENDSESGLNYADARFQSPRLGRFMSLDPIGGDMGDPQSFNRYTYASNDPINFLDPSGLLQDPAEVLCLLNDGGDGEAFGCIWTGFGVNNFGGPPCGIGIGGSISGNFGSGCGTPGITVGPGVGVNNGGFENGIFGLPGGWVPGAPPGLSCIPDIGSCSPPVGAFQDQRVSPPLYLPNPGPFCNGSGNCDYHCDDLACTILHVPGQVVDVRGEKFTIDPSQSTDSELVCPVDMNGECVSVPVLDEPVTTIDLAPLQDLPIDAYWDECMQTANNDVDFHYRFDDFATTLSSAVVGAMMGGASGGTAGAVKGGVKGGGIGTYLKYARKTDHWAMVFQTCLQSHGYPAPGPNAYF